jgi:hypothetical protein
MSSLGYSSVKTFMLPASLYENPMPCFVPELFVVLSFYEKENRYFALVKSIIPRISARHAHF